jgi:hypothetical protein
MVALGTRFKLDPELFALLLRGNQYAYKRKHNRTFFEWLFDTKWVDKKDFYRQAPSLPRAVGRVILKGNSNAEFPNCGKCSMACNG